jgi:MFS family permease
MGKTAANARGKEGKKRMIEPSEKAQKAWVLALTSVASLMVALDALVVTTALGTIRLDLGASIEALQWTMNAYNLSFAVLLLTGAALGDRFGRRRIFVAGLTLFVAASAACALAGSAGWLIAARAVQGAGAALVMPLAMALLSATFPPPERGNALGIFSGLTGLALIAGPVVGGAVPTASRAIPSTSVWCWGSSAWPLPSTASGCC